MIRYIKENNENIIEIPLEYIEDVTLLSIEEYEKYKNIIPRVHNFWWLRSSGISDCYACGVYDNGTVGDHTIVNCKDRGIRPALILDLQSLNFDIGYKFNFGGYIFIILSSNLAICNNIIDKGCFRSDWMKKDSNVYEKSDVKKIVDEWFDGIINKKLGLKSDKEIWEDDNWGF